MKHFTEEWKVGKKYSLQNLAPADFMPRSRTWMIFYNWLIKSCGFDMTNLVSRFAGQIWSDLIYHSDYFIFVLLKDVCNLSNEMSVETDFGYLPLLICLPVSLFSE